MTDLQAYFKVQSKRVNLTENGAEERGTIELLSILKNNLNRTIFYRF